MIVVVHHDDRVGDVPKDEVEAVALDANLLLRGLQSLAATCQLFADVPDVGDVLQDRDGAPHADPVVRDRCCDHLVDQLVALDRIHEGDLAASGRPDALQVPGRERRGEEEVVHPNSAALPRTVLVARTEEALGATVLEHHVVVGVGDEHGVADAVHHPPEPFLLDRVRFARVAKKIDVALHAKRLLRLPREGN